MKMSGTFPLSKNTVDKRRIVELRLRRPFPLPLVVPGPRLDEHLSSQSMIRIGQVDSAAFIGDRLASIVRLECTIHDEIDIERYRGWWLGPDLDRTTAIRASGVMRMYGTLVAATLTQHPAWPNHEPIEFYKETND